VLLVVSLTTASDKKVPAHELPQCPADSETQRSPGDEDGDSSTQEDAQCVPLLQLPQEQTDEPDAMPQASDESTDEEIDTAGT